MPWRSRADIDADRALIRQLSATIVAQSEQIVRLARREVGLAESPSEKRRTVEPLPPEVQALCDGWRTKDAQRAAERDARLLREQLGSWDAVLAHLQPKEAE